MTGTLAIAQIIFQCADRLGDRLVSLANEALTAHEDKKYSLAVLKCGTCLEGILIQYLKRQANVAEPPKTLGPLIGAIRDGGAAPRELLERLNEAGVIRNRASHDHPNDLMRVTEGDSLQILNILALTARCCDSNSAATSQAAEGPQEVPVFLSIGSPHRLDQEQFLNALRSYSRSLGIRLLSLSSAEYSPDKPFDQIRELMMQCRATLVVGLDRTHAYTVFDREDSEREILHQDQFVPTAWNQIEGSVASAMRMEVLVLRERRLHREGIFEASHHRHHIRDFDLAVEAKELSSELRGFLAGWVDRLRLLDKKPSASA